LLLTLIALFILVVATWLAQYWHGRFSGPITALLRAAEEVSKGNLGYRVKVTARGRTCRARERLQSHDRRSRSQSDEIEARRRFTEAILESIPTGVISVDANGAIQLVNKALTEIFPESHARNAIRLEDLFVREDAAEIRYLMKCGRAAPATRCSAGGEDRRADAASVSHGLGRHFCKRRCFQQRRARRFRLRNRHRRHKRSAAGAEDSRLERSGAPCRS